MTNANHFQIKAMKWLAASLFISPNANHYYKYLKKWLASKPRTFLKANHLKRIYRNGLYTNLSAF